MIEGIVFPRIRRGTGLALIVALAFLAGASPATGQTCDPEFRRVCGTVTVGDGSTQCLPPCVPTAYVNAVDPTGTCPSGRWTAGPMDTLICGYGGGGPGTTCSYYFQAIAAPYFPANGGNLYSYTDPQNCLHWEGAAIAWK